MNTMIKNILTSWESSLIRFQFTAGITLRNLDTFGLVPT